MLKWFFLFNLIFAHHSLLKAQDCGKIDAIPNQILPNGFNLPAKMAAKNWAALRNELIPCFAQDLAQAPTSPFVILQRDYLNVYCSHCHGRFSSPPAGVRIDPFDYKGNEKRFLQEKYFFVYT